MVLRRCPLLGSRSSSLLIAMLLASLHVLYLSLVLGLSPTNGLSAAVPAANNSDAPATTSATAVAMATATAYNESAADVDAKPSSSASSPRTFREEFLNQIDDGGWNASPLRVFLEELRIVDEDLVTETHEQKQFFTLFVPTAMAFRRWQPIDWGFNPFTVDSFTKDTIRNHIVLGLYDLSNAKNLVLNTIGNRTITVHNRTHLQALDQDVEIRSEFKHRTWTAVLIDKVLFMNDKIVFELNRNNRDKESPPLIVGRWFFSPFLSHTFQMLKDNEHISIVMRLLGEVSIENYVKGSKYTFFMPVDEAFNAFGKDGARGNSVDDVIEAAEGDDAPNRDIVLENAKILLLNHIVKERIYLRDYVDRNQTFTSLANNTLTLYATTEAPEAAATEASVTTPEDPEGPTAATAAAETPSATVHRETNARYRINNALIISDPIYIYNIGTVYFIDSLLIPETNEIIVSTKTHPIS